MTKRCSRCGQLKELNEFSRDNRSRDGRYCHCKTCVTAYQRNNRENIGAQQKAYKEAKRKSVNGRTRELFSDAKHRAKNKKISFTICKEHVQLLLTIGVCAKSKIKFDLRSKENAFRNPFAPSLDRIDNTRGYEPDNIQLVCNMFNIGKSEHSETDFIAMCIAVAECNADNHAAIIRLMELRTRDQ